jgi:hypothetical protein
MPVMEDEDESVPTVDHHHWHPAKSKHVITFGLPQLSRNRVNLWQKLSVSHDHFKLAF